MKKIMVLGGGVYQVPLIEQIKDSGNFAIVVTPDGNYPGIDIANLHIDMDTRDVERVTDKAIELNIDAIVTTGTDVALPLLGKISDTLNLPGPSYESAKCCTDKVLMKSKLVENRILTANFGVFDTLNDFLGNKKDFGYPIMVKAPDSSGSRGITKVDSPDNLESAFKDALEASASKKVIVEEFLEGFEIGAQVVVVNGKVLDVIVHGDIVTQPPICVPIGHFLPLELEEELHHKITKLAEATVVALEIDNCISNFDIMVVEDNPFIIEVGARMGATCLPENVGIYNSMNYYQLLLDISLGDEINYKPSKKKQANISRLLMSPESGKVASVKFPNAESFIDNFTISMDIKPGDNVKKFVNGTDRIGQVIVHGDTLSECEALMESILKQIEVKFETNRD
ncbi:ATP-grasp domain-containing protein [Aliiglaciecola sp. M165]|uniref:ATP-grasp domain-containing protein n=1 Tax=Aliiglaciecola sp. M165 TaxID=2593649 RepID=UPI00117BEE06|nr:ATP-grasp domain-containing protein [Aliiglaciecola sp. M165]TRY30772.1 ATP-grasp domain-containing protein [Aliiglaciecola sp. M165]